MSDRTSILISIFKRKGAEGNYTRIIDENNINQYDDILSQLGENEKGLIIYRKDEQNWLLLSSNRIITKKEGKPVSILLSDIGAVNIDLQEESKDGVFDKNHFTRIKLTDKKNQTYLLTVEPGKPFQGFFQVLHFLVT